MLNDIKNEQPSAKAPKIPIEQILKFGLVGFLATITHALILSFSVEVAGLQVITGNALAFIVAAVITYSGQSLWVFGVNDHSPGRIMNFLLVASLGLALNIAIMGLVVSGIGAHYLVGFSVATIIVPTITFLFNKFWVFSDKLTSGHRTSSKADVTLAALVAAWALFMATQIGSSYPWYDEGITLLQLAGNGVMTAPNEMALARDFKALMTGDVSLPVLAAEILLSDVHPPVYYWTAEIWSQVFGSDVWIIRALSLTCVAIALLAVVRMTRGLHGIARFGAIALLAVIPSITFSAGSARGYGMAVSLVVLSLMCLQRVYEDRKEGGLSYSGTWFLIGVLLSGLAFLIHYFTVLATVPAVLATIVPAWKARRQSVILAFLIAAIILVVAFPFLKVQLFARPGQYAGFEGMTTEGLAIIRYMIEQVGFARHGSEITFIVKAISAALIVMGLWAAFSRLKTHPTVRLHLTVILGYCLLLFTVFWATDKTIAGAEARYMVFVAPSLSICIAHFFDAILQLRATSKRHCIVGISLSGLAIVAILPFVTGQWAAPLPWAAGDTRSLSKAVQEIEPERSLAIVARHPWGGIHLVSPIPDEVETFLGQDQDAILAAFERAHTFDSIIIIDPYLWNTKLISVIDKSIERLESCGYETTDQYVWKRSSLSNCP